MLLSEPLFFSAFYILKHRKKKILGQQAVCHNIRNADIVIYRGRFAPENLIKPIKGRKNSYFTSSILVYLRSPDVGENLDVELLLLLVLILLDT